jgi:hypothetical protein
MQFSRFASFFLVLLAFGAIALAVPAKRASTADIESVINSLQSAIAPTLTAISMLFSLLAYGHANNIFRYCRHYCRRRKRV